MSSTRMLSTRLPYRLAVAVFLSCLASPGCRRADEISHYTVESSEANPSHGSILSDGGEPTLMLGAIIPHGERTWFFKAMGPPAELEGEGETFRQFIRSVHFSLDEKSAPEWTVPDGWTQQPGSGMRHATLQIGDGGPELTVIALPTPDGGDEYLLSNINRWREQIQLAPIQSDQLATESELVPLEGCEATVVSMSGFQPVTAKAPMVANEKIKSNAPASHFDSGFLSSPRGSSIQCTPPDEWSPGRVDGMRKEAYSVEREGQRVEITVIDLTADVAELLPNVNRWRQQVQLEETTAEALASEMKAFHAGAAVGNYVELIGPETAEPRQTILAVVALHSGRAWFFKLIGDTKLAAEERERFESFVRSVQFRNL